MKYVIHRKCMSTQIPVMDTVVLWLLLDKLQVNEFVAGVIWAVWALVLIGSFLLVLKEKHAMLPGFGER